MTAPVFRKRRTVVSSQAEGLLERAFRAALAARSSASAPFSRNLHLLVLRQRRHFWRKRRPVSRSHSRFFMTMADCGGGRFGERKIEYLHGANVLGDGVLDCYARQWRAVTLRRRLPGATPGFRASSSGSPPCDSLNAARSCCQRLDTLRPKSSALVCLLNASGPNSLTAHAESAWLSRPP